MGVNENGRRFKAGQTFKVDGTWYRVMPGKKGPGDLRLDWRINGEWRPIVLDHVALIVDFIADNENVLHPPPEAGGGKVYQFVRRALKDGWQKANYCLHLERDKKHNPHLFKPDGSA